MLTGNELTQHRSAFRVVLGYGVFAALWILLSDQAVGLLFSDPAQITRASMAKGWLFVAVTTLLLYFLVRRQVARLQAAHRKETESWSEKQRTLDLLSAIADNSEDAIFAKDLKGRYLLFNAAASRHVGKGPGEVLGRDDYSLFPPEQAEFLMDIGRRVVESGYTETNEETLDTPHGRRTFLATKGVLRDADKRIFGIFGISREITERKAAEDEMRARNDELERFNRASVGRELDMIELKRRINALELELGRPASYPRNPEAGGGNPPA